MARISHSPFKKTMPKANPSSAANKRAVAPKSKDQMDGDCQGDDQLSQHSSDIKSIQAVDDDMGIMQKMGKKRAFAEDAAEPEDFSGEMQKMLECFGADISKTLQAKRKRLETYTHSSLKTSNRKVEDIWKGQSQDRQKLSDEFKRQVTSVFTQWETDLEKSKEQEEKLQNLFRQQQKSFQQTRVVQSQRLKTIRQLHDQYMKGMTDLEKTHHDQQTNVHSELRKEMALLQKKILIDTQQQEMANVRKSLQTMLF